LHIHFSLPELYQDKQGGSEKAIPLLGKGGKAKPRDIVRLHFIDFCFLGQGRDVNRVTESRKKAFGFLLRFFIIFGKSSYLVKKKGKKSE